VGAPGSFSANAIKLMRMAIVILASPALTCDVPVQGAVSEGLLGSTDKNGGRYARIAGLFWLATATLDSRSRRGPTIASTAAGTTADTDWRVAPVCKASPVPG